MIDCRIDLAAGIIDRPFLACEGAAISVIWAKNLFSTFRFSVERGGEGQSGVAESSATNSGPYLRHLTAHMWIHPENQGRSHRLGTILGCENQARPDWVPGDGSPAPTSRTLLYLLFWTDTGYVF